MNAKTVGSRCVLAILSLSLLVSGCSTKRKSPLASNHSNAILQQKPDFSVRFNNISRELKVQILTQLAEVTPAWKNIFVAVELKENGSMSFSTSSGMNSGKDAWKSEVILTDENKILLLSANLEKYDLNENQYGRAFVSALSSILNPNDNVVFECSVRESKNGYVVSMNSLPRRPGGLTNVHLDSKYNVVSVKNGL